MVPTRVKPIQDGGRPPCWKIEKLPYFSRGLSDIYKIWHADAVRRSWASQPLKIWNFQNPRWRRPPSWKIGNRPYLRNGSTDLLEIWYDDAYWASEPDWKLKFPTFENPRWRTAANLKIENWPYLRNGSTDLRQIWYDDDGVYPLRNYYKIIRICEHLHGRLIFWILPDSKVSLWVFNLQGAFLETFSAPASNKTICRIRRSFWDRNSMALLYHHTEYCGAWTLCKSTGKKVPGFVFLSITLSNCRVCANDFLVKISE